MITKSSIAHTPKSADAYAVDNDTLHLRLRTAKGEVKKVVLWIGDPYLWEHGGLEGGNLGGDDAHGWVGAIPTEMELETTTELHDHWFAAFVPAKRRTRYAFIVHGNDGEKLIFGEKRVFEINDPKIADVQLSNISNFFAFPYLNPKDVLVTPKWVEKTIWYQIFPERFCNGRPDISPQNVQPWGTEPSPDNYMGGDLWGVLEKLDYLQELGVNGLYFCPIFTAEENHKYNTTDYMNVDPQFGGNEAFKTLVDEAHKRGMKIMLDAVFNHVGDQHPFWLDVVKNGRESKYADWFWIHEFPVYPDLPEEEWDRFNFNYETFASVIEMPKLNTENDDCRKYLLDVARRWVEDFKIDGWRLDVAGDVDHQFWREFRSVVKSINPDCYILGELWHEGMAWLRGDQYDSLMNYPMTGSITDFFGHHHTDKETFMSDINKAYVTYPRNINKAMFNLLDSHDTDRILSICGENKDKAKLAYLFMFTQVGSPCIYYGGEVGMIGDRREYDKNRRCMIWEKDKQDHEMFSFIQKLIQLRKNYPELNESSISWVDINDKDCVAYKRGRLCFVLNNSDEKKIVEIENSEIELSPYGYQVIN